MVLGEVMAMANTICLLSGAMFGLWMGLSRRRQLLDERQAQALRRAVARLEAEDATSVRRAGPLRRMNH